MAVIEAMMEQWQKLVRHVLIDRGCQDGIAVHDIEAIFRGLYNGLRVRTTTNDYN